MPDNTPKGERSAIVLRIPVDTLARMTAAGLTPDRNSWIVDAIERKLTDGPAPVH